MQSKLLLELVWWLITLVLAVLVILPIYLTIRGDYLFYIENVLSIVLLITLSRWILLTRHTFLANKNKINLIILFAMIPLFFICYDNIVDFLAYIDEENISSMLTKLSPDRQVQMGKYIKYEYMFFSVAAMMCVVFIPFRMTLSIWRNINKGTV